MTDIRFRIERGEVDGVPAFWAPARERAAVGLLFRVGRCDETLRTAGITHLVEHLAFPARTRVPRIEFNGVVDGTTSFLWAEGHAPSAFDFLSTTAAGMSELPSGRVERERSIVLTEAGSRGTNSVAHSAALRYGPVGYGLIGYEELGLYHLGPDDITDWSRRFFTQQNAVLLIEGAEPPPELELRLPEGERQPLPEPDPIDYVSYPATFPYGAPDRVTLAFEIERSVEIAVGFAIAETRARDRIRHRAGLAYDVSSTYEPLTPTRAHAVLWSDGLEANVELVRSHLVAVILDLAEQGPTAEELEHESHDFMEQFADPYAVRGRLYYAGSRLLEGAEHQSEHDLIAERAAVSADGVREALAEAFQSMLLIQPAGASRPRGRFHEYPDDSPARVEGRKTRLRTGIRVWRREKVSLTWGDGGIAVEGPEFRRAVRYDECLAVQRWRDGTRGLWSRDGFYVEVSPREWRQGEKVTGDIDARVPESAVIDMEPSEFGDPALERGAQLLQDGRTAEAITSLREGLERRPDSAAGWFLLATCALDLKQPAEALAAGRRATELDPDLAAGYGVQAQARWFVGDVEEAVKLAREALAKNPADLDTLSTAAWILGENGHDEESRRAGQRAVELYPDDGRAWFAEGWAAQTRGDRQEAQESLRKAVELVPGEAQWHSNLGFAILADGRPREALELFDRALKLEAGNRKARWNRALALALLDRVDESRRFRLEIAAEDAADVQADIEANPDDPEPREVRGRLLWLAGKGDEAVVELERAASLDPSRASALGALVEVHAARGRLAEARAAVERALEIAPTALESLYYAAWLYAIVGEADEARRAADAACTHFGAHPRALEAQGYAALAAGEWADARERFDSILHRQPLRCCATVWGGLADLGLGRRESARVALDRGVRLSGECGCPALARLRSELGEPS